ncbi:MAG: hypothetical protein M1834_009020 [Cirrosporium novae-zelandiae]|nr:MAG: hypothetical protein M1834_009020 [Cirrosporium novae-zelandiae]
MFETEAVSTLQQLLTENISIQSVLDVLDRIRNEIQNSNHTMPFTRARQPPPRRPLLRDQNPNPPGCSVRSNTGRRLKRALSPPCTTGTRPKKISKQTFDQQQHDLYTVNGLRLSNESIELLKDIDSIEITDKQKEFFKQYNYLPVTKRQWMEFDNMVRQLQEDYLELGALIVQPHFTFDNEESLSRNPQTKFPITYSSYTKHDTEGVEIFYIKTDKMRRDTFESMGYNPQTTEITVQEFESTSTTKKTTLGPYAVDLAAEDIPDLETNLGLSFRLKTLKGDELKPTTEKIPGLHDPFAYIGTPASAFSIHIEDENLYSVNYVHLGVKTWVIIPPNQKEKLEEKLREIWSDQFQNGQVEPDCSQFGRHLNTYIPTHTLEHWGIEYHILYQKQGQAVITFPNTYHQGFNASFNIAEAINYALDWTIEDYIFCDSRCSKWYLVNNWRPGNAYISQQNSPSIFINEWESVSETLRFTIQGELIDSLKSTKIKRNTNAAIYVEMMLQIASENVLSEVKNFIDNLSNSSAFVPSNPQCPASYAYFTLCRYSATQIWQGNTMIRIGMAWFAMTIDKKVQTARENEKSHRMLHTKMPAGQQGQARKRITETWAKEIMSNLTPSEKEQLTTRKRKNNEDLVEAIRLKIGAYVRQGRFWVKMIEKFNPPILLLIPTSNKYQTFECSSKVATQFLDALYRLRPSLIETSAKYQSAWDLLVKKGFVFDGCLTFTKGVI